MDSKFSTIPTSLPSAPESGNATPKKPVVLERLPVELTQEIGKYLDRKDLRSMAETNRLFQGVFEKQLHSRPTVEQVQRVVETDNVHAFRRFLAHGLDPNMEMDSMLPLLDYVMFCAEGGRQEILKVLLRHRRTSTWGFTLWTSPRLIKADRTFGTLERIRRSGMTVEVVDDEELFPLSATDTWIGALYYEGDRW
jgi:hypothetical protein